MCRFSNPCLSKGQAHLDNGDAVVIPAMGTVGARAKRSKIYLVTPILGVILILQLQWDLFDQLGLFGCDASINSVQSKCGKHGRLNEVAKRGSPNPASNMLWGDSLGLKIIIRASRAVPRARLTSQRLLTSRHSFKFQDSSHSNLILKDHRDAPPRYQEQVRWIACLYRWSAFSAGRE